MERGREADTIERSISAQPDAFAFSSDFMINNEGANLRAILFDSGYLPLRLQISHRGALSAVYVRSSRLLDTRLAGGPECRKVSISALRGRFANHLWQYLFVHLYGLRHCAVVQFTDWFGREVFGFDDEIPTAMPRREFLPFDKSDLAFWDGRHAPVDVDFYGYFQHVPPVWKLHRSYVRRLFTLKQNWNDPLLEARRRLDDRTLVSIHVRRGDYLTFDRPEFMVVPVEWYRKKLAELWSTLAAPVLHVSSDHPQILSEFSDFQSAPASALEPLKALPDHIRDFYLLREADVMLACNSSFSTMAAIQAREHQRCFLPNFRTGGFDPYYPWDETTFWDRFTTPPGEQWNGADRPSVSDPSPGGGRQAWSRLRSLFGSLRAQR